MAIYHDAYLFEPMVFADQATDHILMYEQQPRRAYSALREAGISAFQASENVQLLTETYGGWDETSILAELPPIATNDQYDISFCLTLLLYNSFAESGTVSSFGLETLWQTCDSLLERAGWDGADRTLLTKGKDFGVFFDEYIAKTQHLENSTTKTRSIFQQIRPASTGGRLGWLDLSNVLSLQARLGADNSAIESVFRDDCESTAYEKLQQMLNSSTKNRNGLCLILSG